MRVFYTMNIFRLFSKIILYIYFKVGNPIHDAFKNKKQTKDQKREFLKNLKKNNPQCKIIFK
jgi:hypothetical protein